jgi:hypothetical protein
LKKSEEEVTVDQVAAKIESKIDNDGFAVPSLPTSIQPATKKVKSIDEIQKEVPLVTTVAIDGTKKFGNNMVFLSNLSFEVKQVDIENVFKNVTIKYPPNKNVILAFYFLISNLVSKVCVF